MISHILKKYKVYSNSITQLLLGLEIYMIGQRKQYFPGSGYKLIKKLMILPPQKVLVSTHIKGHIDMDSLTVSHLMYDIFWGCSW